jgi:acetyl/propionyl-CoA carboxylase alpha subunit
VTEAITGIDLVREQLRIAAGEPLGYGQDDIRTNGHAIEFRIYAEDAAGGFIPTTGPVLALHHPTGEGVRVDSGIVPGQEITAAFDPMLAKLIVHAATRQQAIERADRALGDYVLLGCQSNTAFLRRLLHDPTFIAGQVHTGFLDANPQLAAEPPLAADTRARLLAAACLLSRPMRDVADATPDLHAAIGGWRN